MRKIIAIVVCITILFSSTPNVGYASESNLETIYAIREQLGIAERFKSEYGLENVNFETLTYSDTIYAYDYTDEGLILNSEFIPILYDDSLIGWVLKVINDEDVIYQFSTAFVEEIKVYEDSNMNFAIIYDCEASYLYDGEDFYKLRDLPMEVEGRATIQENTNIDSATVSLNNIINQYDINYISTNQNMRIPRYYSCDISFVSQNPPSQICWAAVVACIANYFNGTTRTAESVAQIWFNSTDYFVYNQGLPLEDTNDVLKRFGISYKYYELVPSAGVILRNIQEGYPIAADFLGLNTYHSVVIYGIDVLGGYLSIMDPTSGFCTTTYSATSGHTYVGAYAGVTLTLYSATCKYWTT